MVQITTKHHFIPVFYQKGFTSLDGELFALKKKYGGIKDWSPSQIMYEKNLHTITLGDEKHRFIEGFYASLEDMFKKYLCLICHSALKSK